MEMRVAFIMQRALAQNRKFQGDANAPSPINIRDVLECATVNGANCAGLGEKIGSLAPGREADIVMIRSDDINLYPSNNALGTVVQAADRSNVDTVIVGGRVRKLHGKLVRLDSEKFKRMVEESRRYLFAGEQLQGGPVRGEAAKIVLARLIGVETATLQARDQTRAAFESRHQSL